MAAASRSSESAIAGALTSSARDAALSEGAAGLSSARNIDVAKLERGDSWEIRAGARSGPILVAATGATLALTLRLRRGDSGEGGGVLRTLTLMLTSGRFSSATGGGDACEIFASRLLLGLAYPGGEPATGILEPGWVMETRWKAIPSNLQDRGASHVRPDAIPDRPIANALLGEFGLGGPPRTYCAGCAPALAELHHEDEEDDEEDGQQNYPEGDEIMSAREGCGEGLEVSCPVSRGWRSTAQVECTNAEKTNVVVTTWTSPIKVSLRWMKLPSMIYAVRLTGSSISQAKK
ncbi:predicted protein [Postia placenta Mad-698-R]|nr:predicted protein [Postia placenta Mad-698-R]